MAVRGVAAGAGGWLYWVGRAHELSDLYADSPDTRRRLRRWERLIARRVRRLDRLGARYVQAVVPEKLAVHDEAITFPFPGLADPPGARLARQVEARRPGLMVDLLGPLRAGRGEGPVYLHTDTHWTHRGYRIAYAALCRALDAPACAHVLDGRLSPAEFVFDLGGKLVPPVPETYEAYDFPRHAERVEANALVRLREGGAPTGRGGVFVGSRVVLRNARAPDPRRIVLFGDSYVFDQGPRLTAMLGETFAEVHAIWSANIDWAYVEAVAPDVLVYEIAERFLRRVPTDRIRIDGFAEARVRRATRRPWRERLPRWLGGRARPDG